MLVTLVIVAGSAKGQSTSLRPYLGATQSYTWDGLTSEDTYLFYVTTESDSPVAEGANTYDYIGNAGTYTDNPTGNGSTSASIKIKWLATGNYKVWIKMTDQNTNCTNFRYVPVTVVPNNIDFTIVAMGIDNDNPTTLTSSSVAANAGPACAETAKFGFEYNSQATVNNGSVYVYFKVARTNGNNSYNWYTDIAAKNNGTNAEVEYAEDWSATNAGWSSASVISSSAPVVSSSGSPDNDYFVRVKVNLATASPSNVQDVVATITNGTELTSGLQDAVTTDASNKDNYQVNDIPTIGGFTGN